MFFNPVFLVLLFFPFSSFGSEENLEIFGGRFTSQRADEFPYVGALFYVVADYNNPEIVFKRFFMCTVGMLDPKTALTAAHCVQSFPVLSRLLSLFLNWDLKKGFKLLLQVEIRTNTIHTGDISFERDNKPIYGDVFEVESYEMHPNYCGDCEVKEKSKTVHCVTEKFENDIAKLHLKSEIPKSHRVVYLTYSNEFEPNVHEKYWVAGFGNYNNEPVDEDFSMKDSFYHNWDGKLRYLDFEKIGYSECGKYFKVNDTYMEANEIYHIYYELDINENAHICLSSENSNVFNDKTLVPEGNFAGICSGDSGSPVVVKRKESLIDKFYLTGITSFKRGEGCGENTEDMIFVSTNTKYQKPFIEGTLKGKIMSAIGGTRAYAYVVYIGTPLTFVIVVSIVLFCIMGILITVFACIQDAKRKERLENQ